MNNNYSYFLFGAHASIFRLFLVMASLNSVVQFSNNFLTIALDLSGSRVAMTSFTVNS